MKPSVLALFQFFLIADAQWFDTAPRCRTPDNQSGRCRLVSSCKSMLDALDTLPKPLSPELIEYIRSFQCGSGGRNTKVCCPSGPIYFDNYNENQQLDLTQPPDVSRHRNLHLLPRNCGHLDEDDRIVNGNTTRLFEFPWMALLSYKSKNGPSFRCGGTIINNRYILTAAHCVTNLKFDLTGVRVGEYDLRTPLDCESNEFYQEVCSPPYQDLRIKKVIPHPQYNGKTFTNDIALLRVSPIDLSFENVRPVCLPLAETRNYNFTNRNVIVTGWGATETGRSSPILLKASLSVTPLSECQESYRGIAVLNERQLCAAGRRSNSDSCQGDSGGPLHAIGSLYGEHRLVQQGIVSFGPSDCGKSHLPGVYTRVAYFMDWILNTIRP